MVTGATGYVGAHTTAAFVAAGHSVVALVRSVDRLIEPMAALGVAVPETVIGDMNDSEAVRSALSTCDAVVHCADVHCADVHCDAEVSTDPRSDGLMIERNRNGTRTVLGLAHELGLDPIVHISSTSALFEPGVAALTPDHPIGRSSIPHARSMPHARSAAACEEVARDLQADGAPVAIVYPSGILGPGAGATLGEPATQMARLVARFVASGVMPTRHAALSIIDVRDLAAVIVRLLEPDRGVRRIMCGGHFVGLATLATELRRLTGRRFPVAPVPPAALRWAGSVADAVRGRFNFETASTYEAMALATRWNGTDDTSMTDLGIELRPLSDTLAASLSAWSEAGLVTSRQLGAFEPAMGRPARPPRGIRVPGRVMSSRPLRKFGPRVFPPLHRAIDRLSGGRIIGDSRASPLMILEHTGAKTLTVRRTPLAVVPRSCGTFLALGSNFAQESHPAWTTNLLAHPSTTMHFRGRDIAVEAVLLTGQERADAWDEAITWYPGWVRYAQFTDREFRLFELVPEGHERHPTNRCEP